MGHISRALLQKLSCQGRVMLAVFLEVSFYSYSGSVVLCVYVIFPHIGWAGMGLGWVKVLWGGLCFAFKCRP